MSSVADQLIVAVRDCLGSLRIARDDTIFMHSDAVVLAPFQGLDAPQRIQCLLDALEDYLGSEGTLVIPTFTYSFTKGERFDVRNTPSTVGMISEAFRRRAGVVRNQDPIFSVAAVGAAKREFREANSYECFGQDSAFGLLHRKNARLVGLGCGFLTTFVHYVEKRYGVNYRFEKVFEGELVDEEGIKRTSSVSYFVRDLERKATTNLALLASYLQRRNSMYNTNFGRFRAWGVTAGAFFDAATELLRGNPCSLIEEGARLAA